MKKIWKRRYIFTFIGASIFGLSGCERFHAYEGKVGHRSVALHFRSDRMIDQLWNQCGGESEIQAFAIRRDDGSCEIWISPPNGEDDDQFMRVLYHELGHCEQSSFGTTHQIEPGCAQEQ